MKFAIVFFALLAAGFARSADIKVAALHPLLAHLSREIGGAEIETIDLIGPGGDPHKFEPQAADLKNAAGAKLYLAAGMGLESYLPRLRNIIGKESAVLEVGATLPALKSAHDHDHHDHEGHAHHHNEVDPHWWQSIDLYRRAVTIVSDEFSRLLPGESEKFRARAETARNRLDELERWAKREIAGIPRDRRNLATAHAAFNYFCKDFGFKPYPVQGLNREQVPSAAKIAALVRQLQAEKVAAIFSEKESNPKILRAITSDTGIKLGEPLIADGVGTKSYDAMFRHNVSTIVRALAP